MICAQRRFPFILSDRRSARCARSGHQAPGDTASGGLLLPIPCRASDGKRYKTDVANNVLSKFRLNIKPGLIIDTCEKIHPINEKAYSFPVYLL